MIPLLSYRSSSCSITSVRIRNGTLDADCSLFSKDSALLETIGPSDFPLRCDLYHPRGLSNQERWNLPPEFRNPG